ncbi:MAG: PPC domain-containing DNA-binding protein, partial [Candidatus Caldatribacteriota bacterium]|nr:PPC domain-containing DNA-binding protein [Candidatus Caldatribacteriota bacterium]
NKNTGGKNMKSKKFGNKWVIRIDKGEEIVQTLKNFCQGNKIKLGIINGIGAVNKATIGLFDTKAKEYHSQELIGDYEITNLSGNISSMNKEAYLHLHITLADENQHAYGGHLSSAIISGTGEILIEEIEGEIEREFNKEVGLNLLFG